MKTRDRIAEVESQQRIQFLTCVGIVGIAVWALSNKLGRVETQAYEAATRESVDKVTEIIYHPAVRNHLEDVCSEWAKNNPKEAKRWRERTWGYY